MRGRGDSGELLLTRRRGDAERRRIHRRDAETPRNARSVVSGDLRANVGVGGGRERGRARRGGGAKTRREEEFTAETQRRRGMQVRLYWGTRAPISWFARGGSGEERGAAASGVRAVGG